MKSCHQCKKCSRRGLILYYNRATKHDVELTRHGRHWGCYEAQYTTMEYDVLDVQSDRTDIPTPVTRYYISISGTLHAFKKYIKSYKFLITPM